MQQSSLAVRTPCGTLELMLSLDHEQFRFHVLPLTFSPCLSSTAVALAFVIDVALGHGADPATLGRQLQLAPGCDRTISTGGYPEPHNCVAALAQGLQQLAETMCLTAAEKSAMVPA